MRLVRFATLAAAAVAMAWSAAPVVAQGSDPISVLQQYYQARSRGDLVTAMSLVAPDATYTTGPCAPVCVGTADIQQREVGPAMANGGQYTAVNVSVVGTTVSLQLEVRNRISRQAGIDRFLNNITADVQNGSIASYKAAIDPDDPQTAAYLAFTRAQSAGQTPTPVPAASVYTSTLMEPNQKSAEVSTEELRQILASGSAYVFDARPPEEFAVSHIPGALNVAEKPGTPLSLYVSDVAEVGRLVPDTSAAIVLYCNGPFCGKSKRLSEDLLAAGYTNVRRYQLGAPVWRALGGVMQIEPDAIGYVSADQTAVWIDARSADEFGSGSLRGARNLQVDDVVKAKDDGRLPSLDHNTRIIVFGATGDQAHALADAIARNAFHNVAFFAGTFHDLQALVPVL